MNPICARSNPATLPGEAHLLPLPGQCAGEEQRQPQGFVPVGEFSGEAVLFEVSFYPDAAEVAAAVLRAVYLCPEARPGLRLERIEPGAPGRQREVEHPQRVGRQEPVDRETVAPELGVVALLSGIETAVQDNPAGIDGKCRGDRECAPVGPGRAVEPDLVGNRHTAAQGRIGQQFHEEGQVAEIAFEAAEAFNDSGSSRFCARPSAVKSRCPGDDMSSPNPADVGQGSRCGQVHPDVRSFSAGGIAAG